MIWPRARGLAKEIGVKPCTCRCAILHSDGNLEPCLFDLADTGIHAIQAIDPVAGMDMAGAQQQVGDRLCLCGNVDCGLLLAGQPQQVHQATRHLLATCGQHRGLVLGASNAVETHAPLENYHALIQAWKDHVNHDHQLTAS